MKSPGLDPEHILMKGWFRVYIMRESIWFGDSPNVYNSYFHKELKLNYEKKIIIMSWKYIQFDFYSEREN